MKARRPETSPRLSERTILCTVLALTSSMTASSRVQVENQQSMTKTSRRLVVTMLSNGEVHWVKTGRRR